MFRPRKADRQIRVRDCFLRRCRRLLLSPAHASFSSLTWEIQPQGRERACDVNLYQLFVFLCIPGSFLSSEDMSTSV